jgi:hypothetical protein
MADIHLEAAGAAIAASIVLVALMASHCNADLHRRSQFFPANCFNYVQPSPTEEHLLHFNVQGSLAQLTCHHQH